MARLTRPRQPASRSPLSRRWTPRAFLGVLLCLAVAPAFALKLEVKVEGLEGAQQENVLALLAIYQEREDEALTEPRLRVLHREAPEQIREALAPFGLYRVEVQDQLSAPADGKGSWVASYRVNPGPPIKIGIVDYQVTGEGAENPAFPKEFPMKVGDVLLHADYEKAKSDIRYAASAEGYLDYQLVRHEVLVDPLALSGDCRVSPGYGPALLPRGCPFQAGSTGR